MRRRALGGALALSAGLLATIPPIPAGAQHTGTAGGDWRYWGGDEGSTHFAPLDQIDASNAGRLEEAWRWHAADFGPEPDFVYRATPLEVGGRLYTVAGSRRAVACIDAATGETIWTWRMPPNPRWEAAARKSHGRGVAYAEVDGRPVVYFVTPGSWLVALDAETGRPLSRFGSNGVVDLHLGMGDYPVDAERGILDSGDITGASPPIVVDGVVIVGTAHGRGHAPERMGGVPGHVRGFDARTGARRWVFHVVPRPGEEGHDSWKDDAWRSAGHVSSSVPLSADPSRGLVYVATGAPSNDHYGGHRPGDGLFGTSLLALDVQTGRRAWHFQMVHHDLWAMGTADAPHLVDVTIGGRRVPVVAAVGKQGFAYVFDRETGTPVWPIEERGVPESDVPFELTSPTQPFPTRPAPFELQGITEDDLIDLTPALRAEAAWIAARYRTGPIFTPPSRREDPDGTDGSFVVPAVDGEADVTGSGAVDPEAGVLYVASRRGHSVVSLVPGDRKAEVVGGEDSEMNYVSLEPAAVRGPAGLPLLRPPWGSITAIDLGTGDHLWRITNGGTPREVREHPALEGIEIPVTGKQAHAKILVTRSLLFYGEGPGQEPLLHVVDKASGREIATVDLPAPATAAPMTYLHEGRQYLVLPVGRAPDVPAMLVALALPR